MDIFLSVIIPTYNETQRINSTLIQISEYLDKSRFTYEIIVSDDGSSDNTKAQVELFAKSNSKIKLLALTHKGKGWAVRNGLNYAEGTYRFICDADLSMPISYLEKFLPPSIEHSDIVIGSREIKGARRIGEPKARHVMGRIYNLLTRLIFGMNISDTQCGFKCFRWENVESIFAKQCINGFAFDMEILFLAKKSNLIITEIGIDWYYKDLSKVRPGLDPILMALDLIKIRWRYLTGKYK